MKNATVLRETKMRILAAILDSPKPLTIAQLGEMTGTRINNIHGHLERLAADGMIAWEPHKWATLRATCRFVPAEDLYL